MPESPPEIHVSDDPAAVVGELLAAQATKGGSIVLTGGTTPAQAYRVAAELAPDWRRATVWWSDERCVPPEDERSNYRLVKDQLLDRSRSRRTRSIAFAASCSRPTRRVSSTTRSTASSSTSRCWGRPRRSHGVAVSRFAPARHREPPRDERARGPRAVGRPGHVDVADAHRRRPDRRARDRLGEGRRGCPGVSRRDLAGGAGEPAAAAALPVEVYADEAAAARIER